MPAEGRQPVIVIYSLADALAAAVAADALDLPVILRVPAEVAAGLGADVIGNLFALARSELPHAKLTAAVDCADAPGLALAMLRRGIDRVRVHGSQEMLRRIADIAAQTGAAAALDGSDDDAAPTLDLLAVDSPRTACAAWLEGFKIRCSRPNCQ
ncbi:MAG: hypothetical protein ACXW3P_06205 [Rhodospirillales bacterium]